VRRTKAMPTWARRQPRSPNDQDWRQNGGYRVPTIAELLPPVNEAPVPGPASQVSGGPVRLLQPGPRRRHDEVIGDLPSEALLALV
jgi:hypothetical protein